MVKLDQFVSLIFSFLLLLAVVRVSLNFYRSFLIVLENVDTLRQESIRQSDTLFGMYILEF
jgi:hypothetical protein